MIKMLSAPDHAAAMQVSGKVTAEEYDKVIREIESKLGSHDRITLFVDATGFDDMTEEAVQKRIRYGMSKLGELHRFPRVALVSDKEWIRGMVSHISGLVRQMEIRTFTPRERDKALAWASEPLPVHA